MNEEHDKDLDPSLNHALGSFGTPGEPPPALEDRVVDALQRRGLLQTGRAKGWVRAALALAASLILFSGGFAVGFRLSPPIGGNAAKNSGEVSENPVELPKNRYVLFLYGGDAPGSPAYVGRQNGRPSEEQARISEYKAWAHSLRESGALISGEKLNDAEEILGTPVQTAGGAAPSLGPSALGGYFIIAARDAAQARAIASTCPHLRHKGLIVIRPIDPV